ncbi:Na+/H+ antiporter [Variovorax sp. HJSM1_2]|uniref:Na+/H+ antiporter n=1 Tax=Variovorax sp. HJSM1_2 TaxID=3366263 RepID=UPI003BBD9264
MSTVELVSLLLMLGALSGLVAQWLPAAPLPLLQIALGAIVTLPHHGLHVKLDPEVFLLLFIPPLLFADGWRIPKRELYRLRRPILTLSFGLVLVTVLGVGYFVHWLIPGMPLSVAFALGAVLSPTDAVAVSAITRRLHLPAELQHILEGESLFNDASGLVALKFAVVATLTGVFSLRAAGMDLVWMALGGVAVGAALAWLFVRLRQVVTRRLPEDAILHIVVLLLLLPFATYTLAERLGVSGILAAVACGITINFADLERSEHVAERMQQQSAWNIIESTFNGMIFLLLGLQLPAIIGDGLQDHPGGAWSLLGKVVAVTLVLLGLRWLWMSVAVRRSMHTARRRGRQVSQPTPRLVAVATLAGIRGAITLAGALSIPHVLANGSPFPGRELLVFMASGSIVLTLLVAVVGLPLLLRHQPDEADAPRQREMREARVLAAQAAVETMESMDASETTWPRASLHDDVEYAEVATRIALEYHRRIEAHTPEATSAAEMQREHRLEMALRLRCLQAERAELYRLRRVHRINDHSLRELVQEVDLAEVSVRKHLQGTHSQNGGL